MLSSTFGIGRTGALVAFSLLQGLVTGTSAHAQARVWIVDPIGSAHFRDLQPAIDHSAEGDTLLVMPGEYSPCTINGKSVRLTAETANGVLIPSPGSVASITVINLAPTQSVVLRGIRTENKLVLEDNSGETWVEDCWLWGLRVENSTGVYVTRTSVLDGAELTNSDSYFDDSTIVGPGGAVGLLAPGQDGDTGLVLNGGSAFAIGSTIRGGPGGSSLFGDGFCGGDGGTGLVLDGGAQLTRLDTALEGGQPGQPVCASNAQPSQILSGAITDLPGIARRFDATMVAAEGAPLRWTFDGEPGDGAFLVLSFAPDPLLLLPWNGLLISTLPIIVPAGVVGAQPLVLEIDVTNIGGGTQSLDVFAQGLFVGGPNGHLASPAHTSAIAFESPAFGTDCNTNNVNDAWETRRGDVRDDNLNTVPDSCEVFVTFHVDDDAPGDPGPGDSSTSDPLEDGSAAHPFDSIQEAVDAATAGVETVVLVADGVYQGAGNVDVTLDGHDLTVRSVNGPSSTVVDCAGANRAFRITAFGGGRNRIDGFTIQDGGSVNAGAGVFIFGGNPTVSNCRFLGNIAVERGGAIRAENSATQILACEFVGNSCGERGGAVFGAAVIQDCRFVNNASTGLSSDSLGGAVYGDTTVSRCEFIGNSARRGGAIDGLGPIDSCLFVDNTAVTDGGAVFGGSTIESSTFVGNHATDPFLTSGGAVWGGGSRIRDCVFRGNSAASGSQVYATTILTVDFCNVESGVAGFATGPTATLTYGANNFDADPLFVDAVGGDYRLSPTSPCLDVGDPGNLPLLFELDLDGAPRRVNGVGDLGPYERQ